MSEKQKILLISIPPEQTEETLKDALDNGGVERGVCLRSDIGKNIFKEFNRLKEHGYFCVGMIVEDGFNVEFLFQRHPKQTDKHKLAEIKTPDEIKYKL